MKCYKFNHYGDCACTNSKVVEKLEGIILLNMMPFVITVHSKMLPAKYYHADACVYPLCRHCISKEHVERSKQNTFNLRMIIGIYNLWYDLVYIL